MKALWLYVFCELLCLGIIAPNHKDTHIEVNAIRNADCEIFLPLAGDPMPLLLLDGLVYNGNIETVRFTVIDKTDTEVFALGRICNNAHITPKPMYMEHPETYSRAILDSKSMVVKINLRHTLPEATSRRQQNNNEYVKHPFHAANIAING